MPDHPVTARNPLRLLQILGGADSGPSITGVERVVQALIQRLDPQRFEHFLGYPETGEILPRIRGRVRALFVDVPKRRFDRDWMGKLSAFVQTQRIDLLVTHGWRADFLSTLTCRNLGKPHVIARAAPLADEATWGRARRAFYTLVDTWALHACTAIVTVSEASKERMCHTQRVPAHRITVIRNGVQVPQVSRAEREDARRTLGVGPGDLILGGAGRLVPGKGFDVLIDAAARIQQHVPPLPVHVVILGEGPERERLQERAARQGVKLRLPGFLRNPYPSMAGFDVAVLPSRAEGMPLMALEAMALGIATVTTAVGGCREIIDHGENGYLVPVGDPVRLADILEGLLRDAAIRHRLGVAAAERVLTRHSVDAMVQRFDAFLTQTASHWYEEKRRS